MNITYLSDTLPRCDKWTNRIAIALTHCLGVINGQTELP